MRPSTARVGGNKPVKKDIFEAQDYYTKNKQE